ncbi:hypothetical protein PJ311_06705 [Bacillus sp. CLL-7-23]|uniref:Uncharacterized protein n=1 Tax=Bacillus changyiensis TaxID=3004103 RepID=A0ABT4X290_9BACI|nr:hypothetical protein [Bacillus changyiensis]
MITEISEELGIDSFISYNGQYVLYEGEVINKNQLPTNPFRFCLTILNNVAIL